MADRRDLDEVVGELRARLEEAEETLRAIRGGMVDALVIRGPRGDQVFTLKGAEEPYRIIVERMREGALTLTTDGNIVYSNQGFAKLVGLPLEQVFGKGFGTFIAAEDRGSLGPLLDEAANVSVRSELRLLCGDGTERPALVSMGPLPMDDVSAVSVIITDLTEQKRNEEIAAAERFARSILEQATDAMIVCDRTGRVTRVSRAAEQLSVLPPIGRPFVEAFALEHEPARADAADPAVSIGAWIEAALAGTPVHGFEVRRIGKEEEHFLLSVGPLYNGRDEPIGCIVTLTEITELRKAQLALNAALAEKDTLLAQKEMLLSEVNHRVKNGLQLVASILTLQGRGSDDEKVRQKFDEARNRVLAMARLHGRLQNVDVAGRVPFASYLRALCADLADTLADGDRGRAVIVEADEVELGTDEAIPLALIANELVTNAIKYALPHRGCGAVAVRLRADSGGMVRLEVADDGPGLPADFERAERRGLGMTLVTALAAQLGARIERPPVERGTTFAVLLSESRTID